MADNGADFRARAAALAAKARSTNTQTADVEGTYRPGAAIADPMMAEAAQRQDDAYARRGIGGPLAAGASQDSMLRNAAAKQTAYRNAVNEALARRRGSIAAGYSSAAAQESVEEARRRLEEEKKRREAAAWGDLLGAAGMIGGFALGGPMGAAAGGTLGKVAGSR